MNIDEKLNNMKPKDTPLLVLGYLLLGMMLLLPLTAKADNTNSVIINQVNNEDTDDLVLTISQAGYDNKVNLSIAHDDNTITITQQGNNNEVSWVEQWGSGINWGGDLNGENNTLAFQQRCSRGAACGKSDIGFHIQGDSNKVKYGQGVYMASGSSSNTDMTGSYNSAFSFDGDEGGNHTATLDIHGNNNTLSGYQRNGNLNAYSGHTSRLYLYGDNQTLHAVQEADGAKTLNYTSNVDGTTGYIKQTHNGGHTATVVLNGNYPTNITLLQNSSTAQSYSLTQNCLTSSGCSISVTQD